MNIMVIKEMKRKLFEYNHETTLYESFFFCQFDNTSPQEKKNAK